MVGVAPLIIWRPKRERGARRHAPLGCGAAHVPHQRTAARRVGAADWAAGVCLGADVGLSLGGRGRPSAGWW